MDQPLGPSTAAPVTFNSYDDIRVVFFCIALIVLFYLVLAIHRCCFLRRLRDEPPAAAVSASQHQQVDEISITIYANDGTDDDDGGGNNSESCAICLEDFVAEEELRVLPPCKHKFHKDCVDPWLLARSKSTCPLCREPVVVTRPASDGDYNSDSDYNTDDGFPYGLQGYEMMMVATAPLTTTVDDSISVPVSEI